MQYTYRIRATVTVIDPGLLLHTARRVAQRLDAQAPATLDDAVALILREEDEDAVLYPQDFGLDLDDAVTLVHRDEHTRPAAEWSADPFAAPPTGTLILRIDGDDTHTDSWATAS